MESQVNEDALTTKAKKLIEVSLTVVTDCRPCIESYIGQAANAGASLREVLEAIEIAVGSGGATTADSASYARDVVRKVFGNQPVRASILAKTRW